ncbi:MAG TPA: cyclase family protein [Candidatus Limnocylindrales bacterium]|jgi:kynurenine formamidase|nr:cyclase family protein [Candidatus Limnocylindrales bacterium]
MSRLLVLSHPLRPDAPVWPGNPPAATIELVDSIARGDIDNATRLGLFSHSGTHVDTPWHFNADGPAAWQLPLEAFVFDAPRLIEVPAGEDQLIGRSDLEPHAAAVGEADLLMLRTGWSRHRASDPVAYAERGPLLHPDAARWLIDDHPRLRAIATDAISIGAPRFPQPSIDTHHVLTGVGRSDGRFVLIYEDVNLVAEAAGAIRVLAWPLFIEGADGSPCTIVAELPDSTE